MSDMADDFNAMRAHSQERRAGNREASAKILIDAGIQFKSNNGGAHLIVEHEGKIVHFWPGTGKWKVLRGPGYTQDGRGVFTLLNWLRRSDD